MAATPFCKDEETTTKYLKQYTDVGIHTIVCLLEEQEFSMSKQEILTFLEKFSKAHNIEIKFVHFPIPGKTFPIH